jgi:hypothetical protein
MAVLGTTLATWLRARCPYAGRRIRVSGNGSPVRQVIRKVIGVAAVGAALAVTAVTADAAPTAAQQVVKPDLAYTCAFPSGARHVSVRVEATFPSSGTAGQPIQPTRATVTINIPHAAIAGLLRLNSATVTARASLTTKVTQNSASTDATWAGLRTPAMRIPASGPLVLAASGTVPAATVRAPGNVTFTAAALSILLAPSKADRSVTESSAMPAECMLNSRQDGVLAIVPVTSAVAVSGTGGPPTIQPRPSGPQSGTRAQRQANADCPPLPPGGLKLNPRFPPPTPPKGSQITNLPPLPGCAYVVGFSDVRKLDGAALIGPGLTNLAINLRVVENQKANYVQTDSAGQLEFNGLHQFPPATATLLAFGFMPVTATLQLTELGTVDAYAVGPLSPFNCGKCITTTTIYSLQMLSIHDVKVNGVPLNVGNSCRTVNPFEVAVTGTSPQYNIITGGPLTGTVTVPDFTGCGVGENLNPIFNASVSGPGNFVRLTQGTLCTPSSGNGCPPAKPKPQR